MTVIPTSTTRERMTLADGRTLSWLELGDPAGLPVIFTIGTPSSALGAAGFSPAAARAGLRLVAVDKPGYAGSTRQRGRTLLGYGRDVTELADHLGLDRVALVGQSGGGPHAIAAAHVLGHRVSALLLIASYGPIREEWAAGLNSRAMTPHAWLVRHAPWAMFLPVGMLRLLAGTPKRAERTMRLETRRMSPEERILAQSPESRAVMAGLSDALTDPGAVADEFIAVMGPWGFTLADVPAPVELWHGTADRSCAIDLARGMAERFPDATLHELPGLGHGWFGEELDQAFEALRSRLG